MKTSHTYIRVSTEEQRKKGFSPDNQIRQSKDLAKALGYEIKRVFDDSGRSGRSADKRPALQEMLNDIEKNPVDAIIIYKIDRFARNVGDFSRMYNFLKEKGIKLISVLEGDLMEGGNSLIPNIFASVAQWESEVNSQRTKDGMTQKFEDGWEPNHVYWGYRSVGGENERKTCEPDPITAPIVKELFELYSTGNYSIADLQDWLTEKNMFSKNGTPLSYDVINTTLRNPFYYGLIRWHGRSKIGKHDPIITKELFDVCQYVAAKHRNFVIRKRTHDYLLRSFIYCYVCDQRYTAEPHPNHSKTKPGVVHYYHCQKRNKNGCPAPYVEKDNLEKQVADEIAKMQFTQEFIDKVVEKARDVVEKNRNLASAIAQGIVNQKTGWETKRNKLEDALLEGTIDRDTYKRKHVEIQEKISNLNAQIQELDDKASIDIDLIEEVLSFTRNIHATYLDAPDFMKRHYLRFFFERIYVKDKKICKVIPTPIFLVLQENHLGIFGELMGG